MIIDKEHKRHLKQFHKLSDRHILAVETDMSYSDVLKVVALSDKIRKAGNESSDSNRFTLVTPKSENDVRLQATLGNRNPRACPWE